VGLFGKSRQEHLAEQQNEQQDHRSLDAFHAWSEGPAQKRRNQVFDIDFEAWTERLLVARDSVGATGLTREMLDLAGDAPVVDARGVDGLGAQLEARSTVGAYTTVVRELAQEARVNGGPVEFWESLGRYIEARGFDVLTDPGL
jgi:hypothetical protein